MKAEPAARVDASRTTYVLGFLFRDDGSSVVLIKKDKPAWQAGLLNGVGGKIEAGEAPLEAMVREFREEAGADTSQSGWRQFCEMSGDHFVVHCFTARDSCAWEASASVESEVIVKVHPDDLCQMNCISNLRWLVALALDENGGREFSAAVRYSDT